MHSFKCKWTKHGHKCQGNVQKKKRKKEYENLGLLTRHTVFVLSQGVLFASFTGTNKIIPISPKERWQLATQARDGFCSASHKINKIVKCVLAQQLCSFFFICTNGKWRCDKRSQMNVARLPCRVVGRSPWPEAGEFIGWILLKIL